MAIVGHGVVRVHASRMRSTGWYCRRDIGGDGRGRERDNLIVIFLIKWTWQGSFVVQMSIEVHLIFLRIESIII